MNGTPRSKSQSTTPRTKRKPCENYTDNSTPYTAMRKPHTTMQAMWKRWYIALHSSSCAYNCISRYRCICLCSHVYGNAMCKYIGSWSWTQTTLHQLQQTGTEIRHGVVWSVGVMFSTTVVPPMLALCGRPNPPQAISCLRCGPIRHTSNLWDARPARHQHTNNRCSDLHYYKWKHLSR